MNEYKYVMLEISFQSQHTYFMLNAFLLLNLIKTSFALATLCLTTDGMVKNNGFTFNHNPVLI